jgi:hypothetical protein
MTADGTDGPGNWLVLAPDWYAGMEACCSALTGDTRLLVVTYGRRASSYVSHVRDRVSRHPRSFVVLEASQTHSTASLEGVEVIQRNPVQLSAVGIEVTECLLDWMDAEGSILVYFDSVTGLLQYAGIDETFRFLHPFTGEILEAGARGLFRLAPDAHDALTIETLEQLFDAVIEYDAGRDAFVDRR